MSTTILIQNRRLHVQGRHHQQQVRSWILERLWEGDLSEHALKLKLQHAHCSVCHVMLTHELQWLQDEHYVDFDHSTNRYMLTRLGTQHIASKKPNQNFAKPGWIRLLGHIHPTP